MANQEKPKQKRKKLIMIIGVVLVIILAIGVGVGWRWWQQQQDTGDYQVSPMQQELDNLGSLRDADDQAAFDSQLDKALSGASDDHTKYRLYVEQGHFAMQKNEWQAAIDAYSKAKALTDDSEVNQLLGQAYASMGETAKGTDHYKMAITLIPQDEPRRDAIKREYENIIKQLESGQGIEQGESSEEEPQP